MIIGIDESGTFNLGSKGASFWVGVHILDFKDQKKLAINLEKWKNQYSHFKSGQGEIKGSDVTESVAEEFVKTVIEPIGYFFITINGTIPSDHTKKDIQFHRDHHVKCLDEGIWKCKEIGNTKLAKEYIELRNWYKKINYQLLLKTWILGEMIGYSFVGHVWQVALDKKDRTLGTIKISIDRDFILSSRHVIFWKDILRNQFYSYTYHNPVPVISEWSEDHPFFLAKGKKEGNKKGPFLDAQHVFSKNCNFVLSHESPEVQAADIVASILSRHYNENRFSEAYRKIHCFFVPKGGKPIRMLRMVSEEMARPDDTPNPYEILDKRE